MIFRSKTLTFRNLRLSVLGSYLRWAWHRSNWHISRRFRPAVGKDQRVLQRSYGYISYDNDYVNQINNDLWMRTEILKSKSAARLEVNMDAILTQLRINPKKIRIWSLDRGLFRLFQVTVFLGVETFWFFRCSCVCSCILHFGFHFNVACRALTYCCRLGKFFRRKICSQSCPRRFGTWHNGFSPIRPFWTNLQTRQLRFWWVEAVNSK